MSSKSRDQSTRMPSPPVPFSWWYQLNIANYVQMTLSWNQPTSHQSAFLGIYYRISLALSRHWDDSIRDWGLTSGKSVHLTPANIKTPGSRFYLTASHLRSTHPGMAASLSKPQRMSKADRWSGYGNYTPSWAYREIRHMIRFWALLFPPPHCQNGR